MSSGYSVSGKGDLDDIFDPYHGGTKPAKTGYSVGSQDLRDRYAPRELGADIGFDTHFGPGAQDLRELFAAKGTATAARVIPFGDYEADSVGGVQGAASATFGLSFHPDGTWSINLDALTGTKSGSPTSGNWSKAPGSGAGDDYEIRFGAHMDGLSDGNAGNWGVDTPTDPGSGNWFPLSEAQGCGARTGYIAPGGGGGGTSFVRGYWTIEIRRVGGTIIRTSRCDINLQASL